MAYSSVEHMGVVALGFGFGGPLGVAGALYHMLNHSLNKSLMFFGAGNMMRSYGTKDIGSIHGVGRQLPGVRARSGSPARSPSPARRRSACSSASSRSCAPASSASFSWAVYRHGGAADRHLHRLPQPFPRDVFRPAARRGAPAPARVSRWCVVPMWLCLAAAPGVSACGGRMRLWNYFCHRSRSSLGGRAMNGVETARSAPGRSCPTPRTSCCKTGGRMQMAYALVAASRRQLELRYVASPAGSRPLLRLALRGRTARSRASPRSGRCWAGTSARSPICSGCASPTIPSRYRLVLHEGAPVMPPFDPALSRRTADAVRAHAGWHPDGRERRRAAAAVRTGARRRGGIGRVHLLLRRRADPPLSIRDCSSSIAAWRSASRAARSRAASCWPSASPASAASRMRSLIARRSSAAAGCVVPPRALAAARAARRAGAALQPPALSRPSLPHHDAQGRRGRGQAAGGARQADQRAADRQPLPARPAQSRRAAPRSRAEADGWRRARRRCGGRSARYRAPHWKTPTAISTA